ncbi:family 16 glycosylhydrolase [Pseudonocardia sp. ICBG601]|uniref:glycoside hydrolase family 16 protein n=1 Tax=Pseudonocardia sp. ICBG601 TaxID=2846759 RepID=UPI001CF70641|nr:glycoside hydrolase family 16 protein [Pseudonocardia sp. ICBG601]
MALVLVAAAGLTWTVLVPPDGTAGADPATSALDNQLPPPPPPPPPQQWRQVGGDEFDGSRVDRSTWTVYNSPGGFGNGLRRPSAVGVGDGLLTVTARPRAAGGGVSGGVAMHDGQLYGRWEFRARTDVGTGYSPAILLWPDSERFPDDGELDMMEIPFGDRHAATAFVHYGAQNHILSTASPGDFTQWHTFALDWLPDRITWYVDGVKRWEVTDRRAIPTTPMHLAIQLDQGPASGWIPAPDASTPTRCGCRSTGPACSHPSTTPDSARDRTGTTAGAGHRCRWGRVERSPWTPPPPSWHARSVCTRRPRSRPRSSPRPPGPRSSSPGRGPARPRRWRPASSGSSRPAGCCPSRSSG